SVGRRCPYHLRQPGQRTWRPDPRCRNQYGRCAHGAVHPQRVRDPEERPQRSNEICGFVLLRRSRRRHEMNRVTAKVVTHYRTMARSAGAPIAAALAIAGLLLLGPRAVTSSYAQEPLGIIVFNNGTSLPTWVAIDKGFFEKEGLKMKMGATPGSQEQI